MPSGASCLPYGHSAHTLHLLLCASQHVPTVTAAAVCRHLTCPAENRFCPLCSRNPLKRCRSTDNFATKQFEEVSLTAACRAPIAVAYSTGQTARQPISAGPSSSLAGSAEQQHGAVRLEVCMCICFCMLQASCCKQQQPMPFVLVDEQHSSSQFTSMRPEMLCPLVILSKTSLLHASTFMCTLCAHCYIHKQTF